MKVDQRGITAESMVLRRVSFSLLIMLGFYAAFVAGMTFFYVATADPAGGLFAFLPYALWLVLFCAYSSVLGKRFSRSRALAAAVPPPAAFVLFHAVSLSDRLAEQDVPFVLYAFHVVSLLAFAGILSGFAYLLLRAGTARPR